ncbi:MAG TPA: FecR family protein [Chitinophagaceae bacterium]|nr:FecR family protein [Chitinophagaceae bacterium]
MNERFIYLVGKLLTGTQSFSEKEELDKLLSENEELKQAYRILFSKDTSKDIVDQEEAQQAYAAHFVKMQLAGQFSDGVEDEVEEDITERSSGSKRSLVYWISGVAASFLILFSAYKFLPNQLSSSNSKELNSLAAKNEIVTKKGSKSKIILPDGSLVWLNADSKISYSGDFQGETREMQLTGEAYFDVKKDRNRPFIIHTNSIDVRVLGTAFNVRSYPSEKTTETSLIRGSVEVTLHHQPGKKPIVLKPNDKLTVSHQLKQTISDSDRQESTQRHAVPVVLKLSSIHYKPKDSTVIESSWTENKLAFDEEVFERVIANIERWYNVEILIRNNRVKSKHFSAVFENKSLSQVMEALSLALKFKYEINGNKVTVW